MKDTTYSALRHKPKGSIGLLYSYGQSEERAMRKNCPESSLIPIDRTNWIS